jgi:hypothetical protein
LLAEAAVTYRPTGGVTLYSFIRHLYLALERPPILQRKCE